MRLSPLPPKPAAPVIIPQDAPVYRLKAPLYSQMGEHDHLYLEGEILVYEDEPNQEMEPLNKLAQDAMRKYLKKLDDYGRAAAEKLGKGYTGLADAYENSLLLSKQAGERVRSLNKPQATPLMRAKKQTRGISRIELQEASGEVQVVTRKTAKENVSAAVNTQDLID